MKTLNLLTRNHFMAVFAAAFGFFAFSFCGCAKTQSQPAEDTPETAQARQELPGKKAIVAYCSYSGNTRAVAMQIAEKLAPYTDVELFEIETVKEYPSDYKDLLKEAKKDLDSGYLPELKSLPENFETYQAVFIGSPNWYGTITPALRSFIDKVDLNGKTVMPFFTHGNGGMQNMAKDSAALLKDKGAITLDAIAFKGNPDGAPDKDLDDWLKKLGFGK